MQPQNRSSRAPALLIIVVLTVTTISLAAHWLGSQIGLTGEPETTTHINTLSAIAETGLLSAIAVVIALVIAILLDQAPPKDSGHVESNSTSKKHVNQ